MSLVLIQMMPSNKMPEPGQNGWGGVGVGGGEGLQQKASLTLKQI